MSIPSADSVIARYQQNQSGKIDIFRKAVIVQFNAGIEKQNNPIVLTNISFQWQADMLGELFSDSKYKLEIIDVEDNERGMVSVYHQAQVTILGVPMLNQPFVNKK